MHRTQLKACLIVALGVLAAGCSNNDSPTRSARQIPAKDASAIAASDGTRTSPTAADSLPPASSWDENVPRKGSCSLDTVNGVNPTNATFQLDSLAEATFDGWSATSDLQSPSAVRLYLIGPGKFELEGHAGKPREDVARTFGSGLASSGFRVEATRMVLPPGNYKVFIGSTSTGHGLEICDAGSSVAVR